MRRRHFHVVGARSVYTAPACSELQRGRIEDIPFSEQRPLFGIAEINDESVLRSSVGDVANVELLLVRVASEDFLPRHLARRRRKA